jgi:hypothetical protein
MLREDREQAQQFVAWLSRRFEDTDARYAAFQTDDWVVVAVRGKHAVDLEAFVEVDFDWSVQYVPLALKGDAS